MNIKLIDSYDVLQRSDRTDPCIGHVDIVEHNGQLYEVPTWYQCGKLHHIGDPRPIAEYVK